MENKKIKKNRYKAQSREMAFFSFNFMESLNLTIKVIMSVVCLILCSLLFIFVYDFTTQSGFFCIQKITVSGIHKLSRDEVLDQAGICLGDNILAVNIGIMAKRLLAHNWIREASIRRTLLGTIGIEIQEQKALALAELSQGNHLLMNNRGEPFMLLASPKGDGAPMPVVRGLTLSKDQGVYGFSGPLYHGVMEILTLDGEVGRLLGIIADEETGINVETVCFPASGLDETLDRIVLKMGFDHFEAKYETARTIGEYVADNFPNHRICSMDLFNMNSVTIELREKVVLMDKYNRHGRSMVFVFRPQQNMKAVQFQRSGLPLI